MAVEPGGKIVALLGAPETVTFLRSSAKPHQAIPLIASGLLTALDLPRKRLHLPVGPIAANPFIQVAASMLRKIGLGPDSLKCGCEPFSPEVAKALREQATAKCPSEQLFRKACWHVGCSFTLGHAYRDIRRGKQSGAVGNSSCHLSVFWNSYGRPRSWWMAAACRLA